MAVIPELYDYILTMIEQELAPGRKLPGARRIADKFSCSLPKVQAVLDLLEQSGVVESRERSGTYVRNGYKENILPKNIAVDGCVFEALSGSLPEFHNIFSGFHLSDVFTCGAVEILPALKVVRRRECYQDITGVFKFALAEKTESFFMESAQPFIFDGRVFAVPLLFSPQLLWFNPEIFDAASVPHPESGWGESDFFAAMRSLNRSMDGRNIINYSPAFENWIGFILSAGAMLYDLRRRDPSAADSLPTIGACLRYVNLLRELDLVENFSEKPEEQFADGKLAMYVGSLHSKKLFEKYGMKFVPGMVGMPDLGGRERFFDAFVIAFRKDFPDQKMILRLLDFFFSEDVQLAMGKAGCGVPFLRSAADKIFDFSGNRNKSLIDKLPQFCSGYQIPSDVAGEMIIRSSYLINTGRPEELRQKLYELATVMRYMKSIRL